MSNVWDPDVQLTSAQAARLIDLQFAELRPARLELLGEGFDNWAYRVNEVFVFRFPRRELGAQLMERELRVLPLLAPELPLAASCPTLVGDATDGYPYRFAGYPYLEGVTACRVSWHDSERADTAEALGCFLAALHTIPISESVRAWAPVDFLRRADLPYRTPMIKEKLSQIDLPIERYHNLVSVVDALSQTPPWQGEPCWLHGDLYARHLLVDDSRRITGIIDWGDVHIGDPAEDLSIALSFLPESARPSFREAYGAIDDHTWNRARFRAIFYGAYLTHYGRQIGDKAIAEAGEYALNA